MWIVVGLLAVPLIEIALFVTLGAKLGLWLTLAWILVTGVLGVILLKGVAMLGIDQMSIGMRAELRDPQSSLAHRFLVGIAGIFLLLPGFFTDALGILLLFPPLRRVLISVISRRFPMTVDVAAGAVEGQWQDVTPGAPESGITRPGPGNH
jgi:UPF0716 protein FxsA